MCIRDRRQTWSSCRVDDNQTLETIAHIYQETGQLIDPHTAVGIAAAQENENRNNIPTICLATAHPSKFPEPVQKATGVKPELPSHLADLDQRKEKFSILPNSLEAVKEFILETVRE